MIKIAPSLLAADFSDLKQQISLVEHAGADWLHLDVMDGHFVPNITFGPPVIRSLRKLTKLPFDTHLMIEDADRFVEGFKKAGSDIITVHMEACRHLNRTVQHIKDLGAMAGVCINPSTPVSHLRNIVKFVDLILIMSVNPGFGGQSFIAGSNERLREAADLIKQAKPEVYLEVDGGIDAATVEGAVNAGANVLVAGNFVFGSGDISTAMRTLRDRSTMG
jgi:ribulose-phosphate 3-epimerase